MYYHICIDDYLNKKEIRYYTPKKGVQQQEGPTGKSPGVLVGQHTPVLAPGIEVL